MQFCPTQPTKNTIPNLTIPVAAHKIDHNHHVSHALWALMCVALSLSPPTVSNSQQRAARLFDGWPSASGNALHNGFFAAGTARTWVGRLVHSSRLISSGGPQPCHAIRSNSFKSSCLVQSNVCAALMQNRSEASLAAHHSSITTRAQKNRLPRNNETRGMYVVRCPRRLHTRFAYTYIRMVHNSDQVGGLWVVGGWFVGDESDTIHHHIATVQRTGILFLLHSRH